MATEISTADLRKEIEADSAQGAWPRVKLHLNELWRRTPTPATASFIISQFEKQGPAVGMLASCRLAVLRSFTVEAAMNPLRAMGLLGGIDIQTRVGDFNAYTQEILDPASWVYQFNPTVLLLAVQLRDIAPELWDNFAALPVEERKRSGERVINELRTLIERFRQNSSATILIHNFELPAHSRQGVFDLQAYGDPWQSQTSAIDWLNRELSKMASEFSSVYLVDYNGLITRHGQLRWHDERKWLMVRLPMKADFLPALAKEWLRYLHPVTGRIGKVLVTDLDNTLWGGVIGEEGVQGIKLGREYPGAAYLELQRAMLDLYHRGVLLAVSSKNNQEDAMPAIAEHPAMLLRPNHFAAMRINWKDKASSLREIAEELNVGVDSLVFVDDNPVERQRVRLELPDVTVIELPDDPMEYAAAVRECPLFERVSLSEEDRKRSEFYVGQRQRDEVRSSASSVEDYYRSLDQQVTIAPVHGGTLARVAQLTQKTNQFNLTTRRYSDADIAEFAATPGHDIYAVAVTDRFGDNGLVGVCMTRRSGALCEIDSMLLSCRVIGRTVETAILAYVIEENRKRGVETLEGWFLPTKKNAPAAGFYSSHGFQLAQESEDGRKLWRLPIAAAGSLHPEWIRLVIEAPPAEENKKSKGAHAA